MPLTRTGRLAPWLLVGLLCACGTSTAPEGGAGTAGASRTVEADFHSLKTPPRPEGAIDLLTLSTLPDTVTGGDVLVALRGINEADQWSVARNGEDVSPAFALGEDGTATGLVQDLRMGGNTLTATVRGPKGVRRAVLEVENHEVSGPVISGPHQSPFFCQTEAVGLGQPLDENCRFEPKVQWFARQLTQNFVELEDPFADYPPGTISTQTEDGRSVPWVVRVETRFINRGIARIAVLDDPAARGPEAPFAPLNWNGGVFYVFGESCGVGYTQGQSTPDFVLGGLPDPTAVAADNLLINLAGVSDRLGRGDITVHNTLSAFGNHCNPLISIETTMMTKEHIVEQYGPVQRVVGTNGSGAALQQFNAANNAPGLISAGLPTATFADIPSTAMTVADCGLLLRYYANSDLDWSQQKQAAVNGHNLLSGNQLNAICQSWADTFLDRLDPTTGCPVPEAMRYDPETNPTGVRCTVQEANVNLFGRDPVTGFARRPLDNTGVQYGLKAFNEGTISFEEFLDLNRNIGGYDIDGQWQPDRMAMDPEVERITYAVGAVIGRGALPETPFIDVAPYLDLIPIANIHEAVRPFTIRARLQPRQGGGATHSIFRGVLTQPDVYPIMDDWLDAIAAADAPFGADRVATVINAKPSNADDRCSFGTIGGRLDLPASLLGPLGVEAPLLTQLALPVEVEIPLRVDVPEDFDNGQGTGPCSTLLPVTATPRMVAGMPLSGDVIRCQTKPVDPQDYAAALSPAQLAAIAEVFPQGVCDYALPAAGDVERSPVWLSFGGRQLLPEPKPLRWRVARGLPAND
ncbi:DUF6351 family protein [Algiphilus sp.]|uniref:DUF6351 family protein n=1 Tax=Algiphilus sp. TaxID=1872431 RepID=UPI003B521FB1